MRIREGASFDAREVFGADLGGVAYAARDRRGRLLVKAKGPRTAARLRARLGPNAQLSLVDRGRLDRCPSLEHLAAAFGPGDPVYDPSAVVSRARTLAEFVLSLRAALGEDLDLALFSAGERAVILVLRRPIDGRIERVNAVLARAQKAFAALREQACAEGFAPAVRFTFAAPTSPATPIDRRSHRRLLRRRLGRRLARVAVGSVGAASFAASLAAPAQAQPVGQIAGQGGAHDGSAYGVDGAFGVAGSGVKFQAEGGFIDLDGQTLGDGMAHLFRRDPDTGLWGVTVRWGEVDGMTRWQFGLEAERYIGRTTLTGEFGYEDTDVAGENPYGFAGVGFYPSDHMSIYLTGGYTLGEGVAQASLEVQPAAAAMPGLSLFADAGVGASSEGFVMAGLRFTFGVASSLIDRDRRELIRRRVNPVMFAPDSAS